MKKAYRYDDEIIFYFDAFDNKYVAKGGSLAWRLNNPGLLLSHSLHRTGYSAIGAYHQYAIFSHPVIGKDALRAWICLTKYFDLPLPQKGYGTEKEFKDAVKEVGEIREGQCIWGFINGICNTSTSARKSATLISKVAGDEHVWYLVNDAFFGSSGDAIAQKKGRETKTVKLCIQFLKMLVDLAEQSPSTVHLGTHFGHPLLPINSEGNNK